MNSGHISSLFPLFWVSKDSDDIHVVSNRENSGLNRVMWAPNFPVPNAEALTRIQKPGTWNLALDISETS